MGNGRWGQGDVDRTVTFVVEIECPVSANDFKKKESSEIIVIMKLICSSTTQPVAR